MPSDFTSLMHQIGQRMMVGFDGPELDDKVIDLIRKYKIGNVILFAWNITGKEQLARLCRQIQELVLQETGKPAWIAIDQEGGAVSRLPADTTRVPGAMAIAATGNPENARAAGRITGEELRALGVNFNLAPVLDVNVSDANPVIGVRSYGDRPETVIRYALEMMNGLHEGGVLSCGKHFPGHGDTSVDSHLALPTVDKSLEQLRATELAPFKAAVDAGIPAIMTSHIMFPQLDPQYPATMSRRILTDLLRQEMGFEGLVLTDCMEMKAIQHSFGTVKGALHAVKAGVDLVLVSHTAATAEAVALAIREAVESGDIDRGEWEQSLAKQADWKARFLGGAVTEPGQAGSAGRSVAEAGLAGGLGGTVAELVKVGGLGEKVADLASESGLGGTVAELAKVGSAEHQAANLAILRQTITAVHVPGGKLPVLGERPYFVGCPAFRATMVSNIAQDAFTFPAYMAGVLGGTSTVTAPDPSPEEIAAALEQARGASCIVVGTYNSHLHAGQRALVDGLARIGVPVIAVALRNPYDLQHTDPSVYTLAVYEYTEQAFDALAEVLRGESEAAGRLSVAIRTKG